MAPAVLATILPLLRRTSVPRIPIARSGLAFLFQLPRNDGQWRRNDAEKQVRQLLRLPIVRQCVIDEGFQRYIDRGTCDCGRYRRLKRRRWFYFNDSRPQRGRFEESLLLSLRILPLEFARRWYSRSDRGEWSLA